MQSLDQLLRDFQKSRSEVERFIKNDVTRIIGVESVRAVMQNFDRSSYDSGNGITAWPKRADSTNAQYDRGRVRNKKTRQLSKYRSGKNSVFKGSVYNSANPLLIQTHTLKNSIHFRISNMTVWIGSSGEFTGINGKSGQIATYAEANNAGTSTIPRRQFQPMPHENGNPKILKAVSKKVDYEIQQRMRLFKK